MDRMISRRALLVLVIACNLVLWAGVAVVVGLAASDVVDLGVESFFRELQGTVVTLGQARPTRLATPAPGEVLAAEPEAGQEALASATSAAAGEDGQGLPGAGAAPVDAPAAAPRGGAAADPTPAPPPAAGGEAGPAEGISQPLLLADPPFSSLMVLNTEMSRSAEGRSVQIRYSEAALNAEVQAVLEGNPDVPYENVYVDLLRDQVTVSGDVTVLGFAVTTRVTGRVEADSCQPRIEIDSLTVAGALTPGLVKNSIRGLLEEALAWYPPDYPLCLQEIVVEQDRLTVYGYRR